MMRKEMRSRSLAVLLQATMLFVMLLQSEAIHPKGYMVGDDEGWGLTIDMETWPRGKQFFAGDILVFQYDDTWFDVAVVDKEGHDSCTVNDGAKVFDSGYNEIPLVLGPNYFMDTVHDICAAGTKMAIDAAAPPPPPI